MRRKLGRMRASRAHRKQIRTFLTLDARLLADIGIDRLPAAFLAQLRCSSERSGRLLMGKSVQAQ
jgi:hypothetical protein